MRAIRRAARYSGGPTEVLQQLPTVRISALPRPCARPTNFPAVEWLAAARRADSAPVRPKRIASPSNSMCQAALPAVGGNDRSRGTAVAAIVTRQWLTPRAAQLVEAARVRGGAASAWRLLGLSAQYAVPESRKKERGGVARGEGRITRGPVTTNLDNYTTNRVEVLGGATGKASGGRGRRSARLPTVPLEGAACTTVTCATSDGPLSSAGSIGGTAFSRSISR